MLDAVFFDGSRQSVGLQLGGKNAVDVSHAVVTVS